MGKPGIMLYTVSYSIPPVITEAVKNVKKYADTAYPSVRVVERTDIEVARFLSDASNEERIRELVDQAAQNFLPLSFPLAFGFDPDDLSVSNPHVSLGTSDKAGLKLLDLEQAILDRVRPYIHIPESIPQGVHPKQQAYFKQYGQTDILRWQSGRYTVVRFDDYRSAKSIVSELAERFRPVECRVEVAELSVKST